MRSFVSFRIPLRVCSTSSAAEMSPSSSRSFNRFTLRSAPSRLGISDILVAFLSSFLAMSFSDIMGGKKKEGRMVKVINVFWKVYKRYALKTIWNGCRNCIIKFVNKSCNTVVQGPKSGQNTSCNSSGG